MEITVVTLNTARSHNPKRVLQFKNEIVQRNKSVVFSFQETDINAKRSGNRNIPAECADGLNFHFSQTMTFSAKDVRPTRVINPLAKPDVLWLYGHTLVSSLPLISSQDRLLSRFKSANLVQNYWKAVRADVANNTTTRRGAEPRTVILAKTFTGKRELWFAATHLGRFEDCKAPSPERQKQIKTLLEHIRDVVPEEAPLILMGDFNAMRFNPDMQPLLAAMNYVPNAVATQTNTNGDAAMIDHIFYRGVELASTPEVIDLNKKTRGPAKPHFDHKALLARFEV